MTAYLVCDEPRGMQCWMQLSLPYGYPRWVADVETATPLTHGAASGWAEAYGTRIKGENRARVVPTDRVMEMVKVLTERAMRAQQEAMVDMVWSEQ